MAASEMVRVASFNIRVASTNDGDNHWDYRKELAVEVIRGLSPDVLGTQEGGISQIRYLDEHLEGFIRVGVGRTDGKEVGEFTTVYVREARFEVRESGTFWLSETPAVAGSFGWDAAYPRVVTWVRALDKAAGRRVVIVGTHWDNKGERARVEAARMTLAWLAEHAAGEAVILMGDLNSTEDTAQVKALLDAGAKPRLWDAYREVHPERRGDEATLSRYTGIVEGSRIDFICHSGEMEAVEARIERVCREGRYPSDHYAVSAVLRWR